MSGYEFLELIQLGYTELLEFCLCDPVCQAGYFLLIYLQIQVH